MVVEMATKTEMLNRGNVVLPVHLLHGNVEKNDVVMNMVKVELLLLGLKVDMVERVTGTEVKVDMEAHHQELLVEVLHGNSKDLHLHLEEHRATVVMEIILVEGMATRTDTRSLVWVLPLDLVLHLGWELCIRIMEQLVVLPHRHHHLLVVLLHHRRVTHLHHHLRVINLLHLLLALELRLSSDMKQFLGVSDPVVFARFVVGCHE